MTTLAEIRIVPIGTDVSVRDEIRSARAVLERSGLRVEPHATGTNVEGELSRVLDAVRAIHDRLHGDGVPRVLTTVTIDSRTDKDTDLDAAATT